MQILASVLATLFLAVALGCAAGAAVWAGAAPPFDWRFPAGQPVLLIHHGPKSPACPMAPPRTECDWQHAGLREFSVFYVTAHNNHRQLIVVELSE
jgi:hypothetical protein